MVKEIIFAALFTFTLVTTYLMIKGILMLHMLILSLASCGLGIYLAHRKIKSNEVKV